MQLFFANICKTYQYNTMWHKLLLQHSSCVPCTFFPHSSQISPPPMTRASYWDFKAVWLDAHRVTVPRKITALLPRLVHAAAIVAAAIAKADWSKVCSPAPPLYKSCIPVWVFFLIHRYWIKTFNLMQKKKKKAKLCRRTPKCSTCNNYIKVCCTEFRNKNIQVYKTKTQIQTPVFICTFLNYIIFRFFSEITNCTTICTT